MKLDTLTRPKIIISIVLFAVLFFSIGFYALNNSPPQTLGDSTTDTFSTVTQGITSFTPYYFENNYIPGGLTLVNESVSYSQEVFIFSLINPAGLSVTVSQQPTPDEFALSILQGDEDFDVASGKATVSLTSDGRTTGTLVTSDGTFILINTSSAIELTTIKDILRGLRPF